MVAAMLAGVRSYQRWEWAVLLVENHRPVAVGYSAGWIGVMVLDQRFERPRGVGVQWLPDADHEPNEDFFGRVAESVDFRWWKAGVMWGHSVQGYYYSALSNNFRLLGVKWWVIVLALSPVPLRRMWQALRRRRWERSGRCVGCGYDLRASPTRCPECGRMRSQPSDTSVARGAAS